jgi:CRP/FNR family transcriptional regulator, cyclic AMP receptor protein
MAHDLPPPPPDKNLVDSTVATWQLRRVPDNSILRTHPDEAAVAAQMLVSPTTLGGMNLLNARRVVAYMTAVEAGVGQPLMREGDAQSTGHMLLLLHGEASVENLVVSRMQPLVLTILGPGSLIGEMGLIDGQPRSASCVASTDVLAASLSRESLSALMEDYPSLGAPLMLSIAQRLATRLRETNAKLKSYAQLTQTMQEELHFQLVKTVAGTPPPKA